MHAGEGRALRGARGGQQGALTAEGPEPEPEPPEEKPAPKEVEEEGPEPEEEGPEELPAPEEEEVGAAGLLFLESWKKDARGTRGSRGSLQMHWAPSRKKQ